MDIPHIFTAGIFCTGISKDMPSVDTFLEKFVVDVDKLQNMESPFRIKIGPFVCDALMRAYLKGIVAHNSRNSCERCTVKGDNHGHHITLRNINETRRNDRSFHERIDHAHHKTLELSLLETKINIPMVSGFKRGY